MATATKAEIAVWQNRLDFAFDSRDRLREYEEIEANVRDEIINKGFGFHTLIECYQEFALHTLEECIEHGTPVNAIAICMNVAALRRYRSTLHSYYAGLYFDGGSGIRSVFESTMYLAAVIKGIFPMQELWNVEKEDPNEEVFAGMKRRRFINQRRIQKKVHSHIFGANSGLTPQQTHEIEVMMFLHNTHVHYGESHITQMIHEIKNQNRYRGVYPFHDMNLKSIFANSAVLAAWTHFRVLPFVANPEKYSPVWQERRAILEDSFRFYLESWDHDRVRNAWFSMMDKSFTFPNGKAIPV